MFLERDGLQPQMASGSLMRDGEGGSALEESHDLVEGSCSSRSGASRNLVRHRDSPVFVEDEICLLAWPTARRTPMLPLHLD